LYHPYFLLNDDSLVTASVHATCVAQRQLASPLADSTRLDSTTMCLSCVQCPPATNRLKIYATLWQPARPSDARVPTPARQSDARSDT
jgi:hypothetical protein